MSMLEAGPDNNMALYSTDNDISLTVAPARTSSVHSRMATVQNMCDSTRFQSFIEKAEALRSQFEIYEEYVIY